MDDVRVSMPRSPNGQGRKYGRMKLRYKFSHRADGYLYWYARIPGDIRASEIRACADWFYGQMMVTYGTNKERGEK